MAGARGKGRQRKEILISSSDAVTGRVEGRISSSDLLALLSNTLEEGKAEDVIVIDLVGKTTIADYMVIATGRSQRQINALARNLIQKIKEAGQASPGVEGLPQCDWVLLDAGDVIIHLFRPEVRAFYNLEKMWAVALPDSGSETGPDEVAGDGAVRQA